MRFLMIFLLVAVVAGGGLFYYQRYVSAEKPANFRMEKVKRADLLATIKATGTLEPEEVIDVGAQVAGRIKDFGIDREAEKRLKLNPPPEIAHGRPGAPQTQGTIAGGAQGNKPAQPVPAEPSSKVKRIDYGSIVHEGTELAYIDDALFQAQVDQASAALERARADLRQTESKRDQAKEELARADTLRAIAPVGGTGNVPLIKAISDSDYTLARVNYEVAEANVAVSAATVKQNEAALELAKTNLNYTIIKSPIEGVIITRRVNIGQTVVASLNAPSLFLIAKDLKRMQVWASVNEADIGRIRLNMPVRFTVDAFPGEVFRGTVGQIRMNATTTQNVVTYTVVVETDNPGGKLLPYLTANLHFEIERRPSVLQVPNAALRWKPRLAQVVPEEREQVAPLLSSKSSRSRPAASPGEQPSEERGRVWVQEGDYVRPVEVKIGIGDDSFTEISGPEVKENMEVIVGEVVAEADSGETTNPFGPPKFFKRR